MMLFEYLFQSFINMVLNGQALLQIRLGQLMNPTEIAADYQI